MENGLFYWEIAGFIFVIIAGTILHFVYHWTGQNCIAGLFSPVNESTWEHLKLLFIPMLLYSIVEYFVIGDHFSNFLAAKILGIVFGLLTIVVFFYTYTGIVGKHFLWVDILTFILGVVVAYVYSWRAIHQANAGMTSQFVAIIVAFLLVVCFAIFTFYPPHISLFLDPIYKGYGVSGKNISHQ
ncbi:MAG: DUF6512 family protein [Oscillospiraceae bacterium]|jgi:hypothetical protein|nr:DUF6512 family protein [Oscillospiraceae bacterium]